MLNKDKKESEKAIKVKSLAPIPTFLKRQRKEQEIALHVKVNMKGILWRI